MRSGRPSVHARWVASQQLRLERTRPSTPEGDVGAERRLLRDVAGAGAGAVTPSRSGGRRCWRNGRGSSTPRWGGPWAGGRRRSSCSVRATTADHSVSGAAACTGSRSTGRPRRPTSVAAWTRWALTRRARRRSGSTSSTASAADLGRALEEAGHDADAASLFVCEGLLDSLTLEAAATLCRDGARPGGAGQRARGRLHGGARSGCAGPRRCAPLPTWCARRRTSAGAPSSSPATSRSSWW